MKRAFYYLCLFLGSVVIVATSVSKSMTEGISSEIVELAIEYSSIFGVHLMTGDAVLMVIMMQINKYSHWIITGSIIWLVIFIYLLIIDKRRKKKHVQR